MLVLRRNDGQWIEVTHRASGQVLRFRVYDIDGDRRSACLAFDDAPINFAIERPERSPRVGGPVPRGPLPFIPADASTFVLDQR